eukprot:8127987-Pyramimonas_sp.AAC.1
MCIRDRFSAVGFRRGCSSAVACLFRSVETLQPCMQRVRASVTWQQHEQWQWTQSFSEKQQCGDRERERERERERQSERERYPPTRERERERHRGN